MSISTGSRIGDNAIVIQIRRSNEQERIVHCCVSGPGLPFVTWLMLEDDSCVHGQYFHDLESGMAGFKSR